MGSAEGSVESKQTVDASDERETDEEGSFELVLPGQKVKRGRVMVQEIFSVMEGENAENTTSGPAGNVDFSAILSFMSRIEGRLARIEERQERIERKLDLTLSARKG